MCIRDSNNANKLVQNKIVSSLINGKIEWEAATEDIANITDISVRAKNKTITEILDECLEGTNLTYEVSVSYTHLDVYKRQALRYIIKPFQGTPINI